MLRLIFIVVFLLCVLGGGLVFGLYHWYGWKGLVAFPFVCLALVWVGKKAGGVLIKRFALSLFSMKSGVLRGASIQIHSVIPVANRAQPDAHETVEDDDDGDKQQEDEAVGNEGDDAEEKDDEGEIEEAERKEYFEVDVTITPREGSRERVWEPGELILTSEPVSSLEHIEEKEIGTTENVQIWKDSAFCADEDWKYPGVQRLKLTVAVKAGSSKACLQYYNQSLGEISLPPWTPAGESTAAAPGDAVC